MARDVPSTSVLLYSIEYSTILQYIVENGNQRVDIYYVRKLFVLDPSEVRDGAVLCIIALQYMLSSIQHKTLAVWLQDILDSRGLKTA